MKNTFRKFSALLCLTFLFGCESTPAKNLVSRDARVMPMDQVLRKFELSGFKLDSRKKCLVGPLAWTTRKNSSEAEERLLKKPFVASKFQFGYSVKSKWYQGIVVYFGDYPVRYSRGHWLNQQTMISTPKKQNRYNTKVENPDRFARVEARYADGTLTFSYNGEIEDGVEIPAQYRKEPIVVGISGYQATYTICDVVLMTNESTVKEHLNSTQRVVPAPSGSMPDRS